jgi:hypothetical protein
MLIPLSIEAINSAPRIDCPGARIPGADGRRPVSSGLTPETIDHGAEPTRRRLSQWVLEPAKVMRRPHIGTHHG